MHYWLPVEEGLYRLAGRLAGYALVREGKCLVIDPPAADWVAALKELGVTRVDWVLATHHHRDTLAGAADLVAAGAQLLRAGWRDRPGRPRRRLVADRPDLRPLRL